MRPLDCQLSYHELKLRAIVPVYIGGGPLDHFIMISDDFWRLFCREQMSSSWSRGTMLETPRRRSMRACIGRAARATRPRNL